MNIKIKNKHSFYTLLVIFLLTTLGLAVGIYDPTQGSHDTLWTNVIESKSATFIIIKNWVGIDTDKPQSKLDVNGGIKMGYDDGACASQKSGTLRWNPTSTKLQLCDGTEWKNMAIEGVGGTGGGGVTVGGDGAQIQILEYTLTQSSAYRSCTTASYSTMTDNNGATLAGTNSNNEWIKATFPAQVVVKAITVGGGGAEGCWGNVAAYLNNAVLQYSTDDNNWVTALTINGVTDSGADQFKKFTLSTPITARYWRLYKSNWLATTEFKFEGTKSIINDSITNNSGGGAIGEQNSVYTLSQSSHFSCLNPATYSDLTDSNEGTGIGTYDGNEWVKATFSTPVIVKAVTVGGGSLKSGCWGSVVPYLNGAVVQYSNDNTNWITVLTISGVTDYGETRFKKFTLTTPITAQYWRLSKTGYLATTEFKFE